MRPRTLILAAAILALLLVAGCEGKGEKAAEAEQLSQQDNYAKMQSQQPAESMDYSPTREGINKWMQTWEEKGKISYVYITNGDSVQYLVLEGLPISYCASQTPPDRVVTEFEGTVTRPAPSMDGVYYSGFQCPQYYGFDASTGTYIEFSIGGAQNFFLSEKPLPYPDAQPIGFTTIEEAQSGP